MCGILLHFGKETLPQDHPALEIISHRGPDDRGSVNFPIGDFNLGLGHRRLSIIDLSEKGKQPMSYDNGHLWITYNGEIYNYLEIKSELKKAGYKFISDSDTEVLLAAYLEWGKDCLQRFNGMFALAIYDKLKNEIFLARDRFGIKPLYFFNSPEGFSAFSEIKQVTEFKHFPRRVNKEKLYHFLNSGDFNFDHESIWRDVFAVPEGHYALIDLNTWSPGKNFQIQSWYSADFEVMTDISFAEASTEFRRLLEDSVALRLRADVPIGFLLSGGLDSSTLVGLAHHNPRYKKSHLKTYSTCYDDKNIDERTYIKAVTDYAGAGSCLHFPQPEDFTACLDKVIWHNDLPILHGSPCAHWLLYQHIKKEMDSRKVMIEGQGADEILCGYGDFQWAAMFEKMKATSIHSFINQFLKYWSCFHPSPKIILRKFRRLMFPASVQYPAHPLLNIKELLGEADIPPIAVRREEKTVKQLHQNRMIILKYILHYVDRDSMSHSRETRVPFLDHNLVEFCLKLPTHFKIDKGLSKLVMRDAVSDVLPDIVKKRTDKQGYSSPTAKWIQNELNSYFRKEITECEGLSFVNSEVLNKTLNNSLEQGAYFDPVLWRVLTVKKWMQIFNVSME